jgi:hypothetical protein
MLRTQLYYYPNAARDARVALGFLYFGISLSASKAFVLFRPAQGALLEAQRATSNPLMRQNLVEFPQYLQCLVPHAGAHGEAANQTNHSRVKQDRFQGASEEPESLQAFATKFLRVLSPNFKHGELTDYPSDDMIAELVEDRTVAGGTRQFYAVAHER